MLSGVFTGTTFTGCPMTTLGNTLRTIMMLKFAIMHQGIHLQTSYKIMAAGDDSVVMIPRQYVGQLINSCANIWHFGDEMLAPAFIGLGQLGRDLKVQDQSIDFLSKRILMMGGQFRVSRKAERAILQS